MLLSSLIAVAVLAAPAPAQELPLLAGDLPSLAQAAGPPPPGGVRGGERVEVVRPKACGADTAVHLSRVLQVSLHTLSKLQGWLDQTDGLEARLFSGKGRLAEVSKLVSGAEPSARLCTVPSADGWKLVPQKAPPSKCKASEVPAGRLGDYWWTHAAKPAAVVAVSEPAPGADNCRPRVSAVLFDQTGKARLRFHSDLYAPPQFTLLGDRCQALEFSHDEKVSGFKATPTPCKP